MVVPVSAQISKLRPYPPCPTLPTTHHSLPTFFSSASHGADISPVLNSFRILPVPTGVPVNLPNASGEPFEGANSSASYHIPATPAVSCNYTLFRATARLYPFYFQELPHSFYRHGGCTLCGLSAPIFAPSVLGFFPQLCALCFQQLAASFFSLCSLFANPTLCFQSLADSFSKTPGG
jgi:hypothetical protein